MPEGKKDLSRAIAISIKGHLSNLIIPSIEIDEKPPGTETGRSDFIFVTDADNNAADENIRQRLKISFNTSAEVVEFDKDEKTLDLGIKIGTKIKEITDIEDHFKALIDAELEYLKLVLFEELNLFPPDKKTGLGFTMKNTIIDILDCELVQILFNMSKIIKHIDDKNKVEPDFSTKINELKQKKSIPILETSGDTPVNKLISSIHTITDTLPELSKMLDNLLKTDDLEGHEYKLINYLYDYFKLCYETILKIRNRFHSSNKESLTKLKLAVTGQLKLEEVEKNIVAFRDKHSKLATEITEFLSPKTDPSLLDTYFYYPLANVYTLIQSEGLLTKEMELQKEKRDKIDELNQKLNTIKLERSEQDSKRERIQDLFDQIDNYKNQAYKIYTELLPQIPELPSSRGGSRKRTKRKKQKNNKVSQRKNRIKVKKHASRKGRAKGKSKKGRKL